MPMDPRKRATHGSRRGKITEDLTAAAKNVGPLAASFIPGVGEAMDAKDLYSSVKGGDWLGAGLSAGALGLGLIPGVGDAAAAGLRRGKQFARGVGQVAKGDKRGKLAMEGALGIGRQKKGPLAPEIAYATNEFGTIDPGFRLTPHQRNAAERDFGLDPDAPVYSMIMNDMQREFKDPSKAIGKVHEPVKIRDAMPGNRRDIPGADNLHYKQYDLPEGHGTIHSTYSDKGAVRNVLGGGGPNLPSGDAKTFTGKGEMRPSGNFQPVTGAMKAKGHTGPRKDLQTILGETAERKRKMELLKKAGLM